MPSPSLPRRLDSRIKLALLIAACFASQSLPADLLPPWLAALGCLFLAGEMRRAEPLAMLRGGLGFTLFWLFMKTASDWLGGAGWADSLAGSLPLAGRLAAFTAVGVAFAAFSPPVETGRAVAWFLSPLAGKQAWKPALAVALTAWFLPQILRLIPAMLEGVRARGLERLPWRKKAVLLVGASLRVLERRAGELAVGLASRRLDDHRTWGAVGITTPSAARRAAPGPRR